MQELLRRFSENPELGLENLLLHLLLSFVLSQFLAWIYIASHHGMSYSRSQVQSLVLLALIVTLVMLSVGNNLARAFGLFGALALVRFRTPIKDSRDTSFLFLAVGIGISVGAGQLMLASVGTVFIGGVALYLARFRFGERIDRNAMLRFAMTQSDESSQGIEELLQRHCEEFSLVQVREALGGKAMEYAYQLRLIDAEEGAEMIHDLQHLPGVSNPNLFLQEEDREP